MIFIFLNKENYKLNFCENWMPIPVSTALTIACFPPIFPSSQNGSLGHWFKIYV